MILLSAGVLWFAAPAVGTADQVIMDDLIVDGRACVGAACADMEPFGDEALRLNHANPWIRFEDSSTDPFPSNDWQITVNDVNMGGANFFAIEDLDGGTTPFTIEAGAQDNTLYVAANGNIGIRTDSPAFPLHIVRQESGAATVFRFENDGPTRFILDNTSGDFWVFNSAANGLRINVNGDPDTRFLLDTDGNLTIRGSLMTAMNTISDHVFEPDYALMSLEELAAFVKREKHLPNFPSAAEVEKTGRVNMTEMQMKLLEKIEELTLYTLVQEETLTRQAATIEKLEGTIEKLTTRLAALEQAGAAGQP